MDPYGKGGKSKSKFKLKTLSICEQLDIKIFQEPEVQEKATEMKISERELTRGPGWVPCPRPLRDNAVKVYALCIFGSCNLK